MNPANPANPAPNLPFPDPFLPVDVAPVGLATPQELRPRRRLRALRTAHVPRMIFRTMFFLTVKPKHWYFEEFLRRGYLGTEDFVWDLRLLAGCRARTPEVGRLKRYCQRLANYYESEEGSQLLEQLEAQHMARLEQQTRQSDLLGLGHQHQQQQQQHQQHQQHQQQHQQQQHQQQQQQQQ
ncbi:hypothetical protein BGX31_004988 [Mortierella sp. GBA43]|nr:hypothetical protein BGX31_004988 [Mortierella sp. GBA43]